MSLSQCKVKRQTLVSSLIAQWSELDKYNKYLLLTLQRILLSRFKGFSFSQFHFILLSLSLSLCLSLSLHLFIIISINSFALNNQTRVFSLEICTLIPHRLQVCILVIISKRFPVCINVPQQNSTLPQPCLFSHYFFKGKCKYYVRIQSCPSSSKQFCCPCLR